MSDCKYCTVSFRSSCIRANLHLCDAYLIGQLHPSPRACRKDSETLRRRRHASNSRRHGCRVYVAARPHRSLGGRGEGIWVPKMPDDSSPEQSLGKSGDGPRFRGYVSSGTVYWTLLHQGGRSPASEAAHHSLIRLQILPIPCAKSSR